MVTPRSTATWPASGCSSFTIMRKIVDFPQPLGPTRPTFSPLKTLIAASRKRICLPCCFETESSRITRAKVTGSRQSASAHSALRGGDLDAGGGTAGAAGADDHRDGHLRFLVLDDKHAHLRGRRFGLLL